jgi:glycosyltransferase involved in cell wall biosynthesis
MKILMLETSGLGGIAHYTYNLCQSLAEHLNVILVTSVQYELAEYHRKFDLQKIIRSEQSYLKKIFTLLQIIKSEKPDILHIQSALTARRDWLLFTALNLWGVPVVLTVHNVFPHDDVERFARGMRFSLNRIYSSCRALIVHSQWSKREFLSNFKIDESKVYSIPHGNYLFLADDKTKFTKKKSRERLGLRTEDKVILSFGAIREYKGIQYLIPAFSQVREKIPDARLIIVGSSTGENSDRCRKLIEDYGIGEDTLFIPKYALMEEIPLYFSTADVVVFPYVHTYGSGALQSALAFSKPVVVSRVGEFIEIVEEGRNGYFALPQDSQNLAAALFKILSLDDTVLEKMGRHSSYLADTKHNWSTIEMATRQAYKEVLGSAL